MSVCQQRDISALSPPIPMITGVEEVGPLERGCFYAASGIMGSPLLQFAWLCWKFSHVSYESGDAPKRPMPSPSDGQVWEFEPPPYLNPELLLCVLLLLQEALQLFKADSKCVSAAGSNTPASSVTPMCPSLGTFGMVEKGLVLTLENTLAPSCRVVFSQCLFSSDALVVLLIDTTNPQCGLTGTDIL
ncbi:hypothetical protein ATANTOWER_002326 [Ataeniobius toweri]|uniref:Uncharacterized protein n=1 Tax=Ataeniobius toweri TaxID=208326 RepID=A0ABU7A3X0_9TELE|nr:hypothetical protein [Ataeniobius toweri]